MEKGEWILKKEEIEELKNKIIKLQELQNNIFKTAHSTNLAETRKIDINRKFYKKEKSIKDGRIALNTLAAKLRKRYDFCFKYELPFGNVLHAIGFNTEENIINYFKTKRNPNKNYEILNKGDIPLEERYSCEKWIELLKMNWKLAIELHQIFKPVKGKITMVAETDYDIDFWQTELNEIDGVKIVDIKLSDSDSDQSN